MRLSKSACGTTDRGTPSGERTGGEGEQNNSNSKHDVNSNIT